MQCILAYWEIIPFTVSVLQSKLKLVLKLLDPYETGRYFINLYDSTLPYTFFLALSKVTPFLTD